MESGQSCDKNGMLIQKLTDHSYDVRTYTGTDVLAVRKETEELLATAAHWSRGEFLAEDALNMLLAKKMILWIFSRDRNIHLVGLTEIRDYPRKRVCHIYAIAGEGLKTTWLFAVKEFRDWLEEQQIDEITATCRDSVARMLAQVGFDKIANVMSYKWKDML